MTRGLFSVVVASYGVVEYMDTFLTSLVRQTFSFQDLDIIIVDDESIDGSYGKAKEWEAKYPSVIRVATKKNGGPASARNVGIGMARNEWVTFCDPDDALQADYFSNVASFIARDKKKQAAILTTRVMIWQEKSGKVSDTHPLARKYFFGERLVNLEKEPNNIQLGGASIFLKKSIIDENELRFDERIRPTFEDGEFIGRFMSYLDKPIVGLVSNARYLYRKRGDGSSLVQSGWAHPERYDEVLRYGYIGMLRGLKERLGYVPVWAQNMVLYDIQWYLSEDKKMNSSTAWIDERQQEILHELLRETFTYIDRETIDSYSVTPWSWITRESVLSHYKGQGLKVKRVFLWSAKNSSPTHIVYTYSGTTPNEIFVVDDEVVQPIRVKSVAHSYYGETFVIERSVWLPSSVQPNVWLNDTFVPFESPKRPGWSKPLTSADLRLSPVRVTTGNKGLSAATLRNVISQSKVIAGPMESFEKAQVKLENRVAIDRLVFGGNRAQATSNIAKRVLLRKLASIKARRQKLADEATVVWANSPAAKSKYRNAWVVMDRVDKADDNGEHLYRYIARERPEINAWFLLQRDSSDWDRLSNEGFRLVEYGSKEAVGLCMSAEFQISSDATQGVQYPLPKNRFGGTDAKIVFLQHGVIKDDLSRWLNSKDLSMFVTSTKSEYDSIAGDLSPYKFTSKETKLTGLPRFDSLMEKRNLVSKPERRTILVMPTWRQDLRDDLNEAKTVEDKRLILESSDFGLNWFGLLRDNRFKQFCDQNELQVVFVPHPAMNSLVELLEIPSYIDIFDSQTSSLQDKLAVAAVTVTDYSSIAFDAAIVGSPVLYFQFDADSIFSGSHSYRRGYYDYTQDGFGPIAIDSEALLGCLKALANKGFDRDELYERRVMDTFEFIDSNNCRRVVEAINELKVSY